METFFKIIISKLQKNKKKRKEKRKKKKQQWMKRNTKQNQLGLFSSFISQ
jgi:hypothetical protein